MTEEQKTAKSLFSARNAAILSTLLTAFGGAFYQVYDWAYESGFTAGKLEIIEKGDTSDETKELEREIRRLKRKLKRCEKKQDGSSLLPTTESTD